MTEVSNPILSYIVGIQQNLNSVITDSFDKLDSGDTSMYPYILLVALIYGLVHALGPGHGKMIIGSYFLVKGAKAKEAFKAGFLTSIIHTISALLITGTLYIFFKDSITGYFDDVNTNMYKVSAVFIIGISLYLLYELISHKDEEEKLENVNNKSIMTIALSIGIVPCPGVMTIVLFSMIMGFVYLGVLSAVTMSIGMGITISLAAIVSTKMKTSKLKDKYKHIFEKITYVAVAVLFGLGVSLLI